MVIRSKGSRKLVEMTYVSLINFGLTFVILVLFCFHNFQIKVYFNSFNKNIKNHKLLFFILGGIIRQLTNLIEKNKKYRSK